jgi:glycosyltransferase involved in cell wall biosynthesis
MRYLWELYPDYLNDWTRSSLKRMLMRPVARNLRLWDFASSARVDRFVANSANVQRRIWKTYRRESAIVHPPVAVETFFYRPPEDFFLIVSELVSYKRLDYAIRHFSRTGRKLRVVGDGPEYKNLKRLAGSAVEFCGRVSAEDLRELYARSRALVVPGEEDFGITIVEALASGKPVLALGRGGACEIVGQECGLLYASPTEHDLAQTLTRFDSVDHKFLPKLLQGWAANFSEARFEANMERILATPDPVTDAVPVPIV